MGDVAAADPNHPRAKERSVKGRRRREAAKQRRMEEQQWGEYANDEQDRQANISMPPRRRPARRRNRVRPPPVDLDLEIAFAVSLSLGDSEESGTEGARRGDVVDMSYESLVQLESVRRVAPPAVVSSFAVSAFAGKEARREGVCAICLCEYEIGEEIMGLPCTHGFHKLCGSQWLLNHSKTCPICKGDVTSAIPNGN